MASNHSSSYKVPDSEKQHGDVLGGYKSQFPDINERNLTLKIDLRLIPALCVLYFLSFLDRVNIGNAAVYGLITDLKLQANQFNTALVIFFVSYIVFEIPANLLIRRFKPHVWLTTCMFFFGVVSCLQGTVTNYSGLLATRFFLGVCESTILPGLLYLVSMWYKRCEAQKRFSFLVVFTSMAGAFGGLLASAIGNMDGFGGYRAWRWVFILEGLLSCVVSVVLYFCISDFPEDVKWLSIEEKAFIKHKLHEEVGGFDVNRKITFKDVINVLIDYRVILGGFMFMGLVVPAYSYSYFAPAIIQGLGHSPIQTQLYSVPPWVSGFGLSMFIGTVSDVFQHRFIFSLMTTAVALAGYIICMTVHNRPHLQYAALFLCVAGIYSAMPIVLCWYCNNLGGHLRRSVGIAWMIAFGNVGGFIAAYTFFAKDAPKYTTGFSICLAFLCLTFLACLLYFLGIAAENRRRERGDVKDANLPENEKLLMGDLNPDYRYML